MHTAEQIISKKSVRYLSPSNETTPTTHAADSRSSPNDLLPKGPSVRHSQFKKLYPFRNEKEEQSPEKKKKDRDDREVCSDDNADWSENASFKEDDDADAFAAAAVVPFAVMGEDIHELRMSQQVQMENMMEMKNQISTIMEILKGRR
jgi:hypothetical protein